MSSVADSSSSFKGLKSLSELFEVVIHATTQDVLIDEDPQLYQDTVSDENTLEQSILIKFVTESRNEVCNTDSCSNENNLITSISTKASLQTDNKILRLPVLKSGRKFSQFSILNKSDQNKKVYLNSIIIYMLNNEHSLNLI